MALTIFKAFRSTVTAFTERMIGASDRWLTDPTTGAITGVQTQTGNGPDARFVPVDITGAQLAAPTAAMLADIDATYRLNQAPYSRFMSNGVTLVPAGADETMIIVPAGQTQIFYAPLTISYPQIMIVEGTAVIRSLPA